jgi:membrane-associated protein
MGKGHFMSLLTKTLNALFTIVIFGLLLLTLFRPDLVEKFILLIGEWVKFIGAWNYLLVFVSSCIESFPVIGVLVPGQQVMLLVGGFYGREHLFPVMALASVGAMLGNWFGYVLGVRYGKAFLRHHGDTFGIGLTEQKILEKQILKNGPWFIVLGKFHNFTRSFVPFIAGTMGMQSKLFWPYNLAGSIFWACMMMVLGIFFTTYLKVILDSIGYIFLALII